MPSHRYPTRFQERLFYYDQYAAESIPNETVEAHLDTYWDLVAEVWRLPEDDLSPYPILFQFLLEHSYLFHRKPELVTMIKDELPKLRRQITAIYEQYAIYTEEYYNVYHARQHSTLLYTELEALRLYIERTYLAPYGQHVNLAIRLSTILDNLESVLPAF